MLFRSERYTKDSLPYCSHEVIAMMKNKGYMPGMGLGKEGKGVVEFLDVKTQVTREGVGFFAGYDGIRKKTLALLMGTL